MDIIEDIRPLTEFKRDTNRFASRLKKTGRPAILTVNGKPSLVVMDAEAWQAMQDQNDYRKTVAAIRKGLDEVRNGEDVDAEEFFEQLGKETR